MPETIHLTTHNIKRISSVLLLASLTYFTNGAVRYCLPVLFKEISVDLGLSLVEIGFIWGMDPLAGIFVALPAGLAADRFGVKRTLTFICIAEGVLAALRGFASNAISLTVIMFLFGLMAASMPSVVPKVISSSFKGRNLALSQSLIATCGFLGAMSGTMFSATFFSPLLGGWRNSVFLYGLPIIIVGILWMTRARTPPTAAVSNIESGIPIKESLSHIIRVKRIWVIGLMSLCMGAAYVGLSGYLALYLRKIGWEPASADLSVTLLIACTAAGSIPLILLAYRLGSHKNMILWGHIVMAIATGLLSIAGDSTIWVLVTVIGLIWGAVNPIYIVLALETREVGTRYAGTALGLLSMISMAGGFVSPPLGNSLATINPGFPFLFWAALYLVALPGFAFLKDEVRVTNTSRS